MTESSFEQVHQPRAPWIGLAHSPGERSQQCDTQHISQKSAGTLIAKILDYGLQHLTPWTTSPLKLPVLAISPALYVPAPSSETLSQVGLSSPWIRASLFVSWSLSSFPKTLVSIIPNTCISSTQTPNFPSRSQFYPSASPLLFG